VRWVKVGINSDLDGSTVGTQVRATRLSQYAKWMQLDREVSEDGDIVVLIHKQLCALDQFGWCVVVDQNVLG